ncbi:cyclopropane-fatty-acyl-phospholipid synthase family protein [Blastopirellula sp. JC732]|uniref:Cyclopropane-fatty-acyl-phospholipid synthase family protein n=1 Tax=Blastopirellula sediminis TaxID=2894196 RepID=A0A9X1MMB5_9BACT|nr:cyclopropane-fatty-acyl-phospholipid synthase family protein [Blastopirellula sediminis]MCC9608363.1 cyclopropane-fatty-acyl-phospholipid synthase family protein [Blastopirellula sediminis]MCC9628860.1 cyclopropane-fatty-acyl-phospholipid synthase family protein [Blastopirellula sediminis]
MGQAELLENSRRSSWFGLLLDAAENGRLPDALIRFGVRRLLNEGIEQRSLRCNEHALENFLRAAQAAPIAVVPQKANEQHYEVPASFFQKVLGDRLKYSCGYWSPQTRSLKEAEEVALRITCEHAQLMDGMDVLELGCGWGSLSLWMAQKYPNSRITSVSNSNSQREFIQARAEKLGLSNLTVITADMNDFAPTQTFDRVVSVEMFEHMRNHRELMRRINDWLRPGGKLFVHIFCQHEPPYLFQSEGEANWMGRYFFSGGMMPSVDLLPKCGSPLQLESHWTWNGSHYAKTCRAWLKNQDAAKQEIRKLFAEIYGSKEANRWHNRWRMFFIACEELFAYRGGQQWFVSHYLFQRCPLN